MKAACRIHSSQVPHLPPIVNAPESEYCCSIGITAQVSTCVDLHANSIVLHRSTCHWVHVAAIKAGEGEYSKQAQPYGGFTA